MRKASALLVIALVAVFAIGTSGVARAGAFGIPDDSPSAAVVGWFDITVSGTDNNLPVILNLQGSDQLVHFVIYSNKSVHVYDKTITLTRWDASPQEFADIRSLIENEVAPSRKAQLLNDEGDRYEGYWIACTVFAETGSEPDVDVYPHSYKNVLGGWIYLVDILNGVTDGYPAVNIEAATLWAGDFNIAFMLSGSADFFDRDWWWADQNNLDYDTAAVQGANVTAPWVSRLWKEGGTDQFWTQTEIDGITAQPPLLVHKAQVNKVFERFDAVAGLNAQLLSTGRSVTTGDDTILARLDNGIGDPYGGANMTLYARYFADESELIANYSNRGVIWCDTPWNDELDDRVWNILTCNEEEDCPSAQIPLPYELNIFDFVDIVPPSHVTGYLIMPTLANGGIENPDSSNLNMAVYWQELTNYGVSWPATAGYLGAWYPKGGTAAGDAVDIASQLQLLGWTVNIGLGSVQQSWSAVFPMLRKYEVGSNAVRIDSIASINMP